MTDRRRQVAAWIALIGFLAAFLASVVAAQTGNALLGVFGGAFLVVGLAGLVWWSLLRKQKP
ncbi:hypothetical protein [Microbacterium sp. NPDC087665]|uniref:hypothetical protein n=1 Tax=Microbacterium sp. NPDC087665 TaxID=3364194 RepID=UPI0038176F9A